ncbi:gas vesicle protein GvpG [Salsuginibacillus halophilus]|uniref:Gas vesicle protein GvpG n=1 Tax=Salsuginibacillus halophilus TaxID=517424 RepID=A0A2P8HLK1_9BACI|nr:gas vesicle protein GvpG [Salsuginibacillus halophilus]PSL47083.1 gas vesicle protein GvpG [Salsuginibacillus halophilus]
MFRALTWPVRSLKFIGETIKEEVDKELFDLETIKQRMVAAQVEFERGNLTKEAFEEEQAVLAERYRQAKAQELKELREALQQDQQPQKEAGEEPVNRRKQRSRRRRRRR